MSKERGNLLSEKLSLIKNKQALLRHISQLKEEVAQKEQEKIEKAIEIVTLQMQEHYPSLTWLWVAQGFRLDWFEHGFVKDEQKYPFSKTYNAAKEVYNLQQRYHTLKLDILAFGIVWLLDQKDLYPSKQMPRTKN